MKIGFTGTQDGMTTKQRHMVRNLLEELDPDEVHHGDCVGADANFHDVAFAQHRHIIIHPGHGSRGEMTKRAFCEPHMNRGLILHPLPYLARNKNIVTATDALIATPSQDREIQRSGTWATIRTARDLDKTIYIIFPDGQVWDGKPF
jgi:hypothetical protein